MADATLPFEADFLATSTYAHAGETAHAEHVVVVDESGTAVAVDGAVRQASPTAAAYGAVSVGSTATRLDPAPTTSRKAVSIANADATLDLYIGFDSSVTTGTGFPIPAGQSIDLDVTDAVELWAIVTAGTVSARIIQTGS